jgi:hypothetical protein
MPRSNSPIGGESDPVTVKSMKPRVYLETTIPSYLAAWPSRDLVPAAHQQITREWWQRRQDYELFVSQLVIRECRAGDLEAAEERLEALEGIALLAQVEANQRREVYRGGDAAWNGRAVGDEQGSLRLLCMPQDVQAAWLVELGSRRPAASVSLPGLQAADGPHGPVLQGAPAKVGEGLGAGRGGVSRG